jgi:hypothetical protein
MLKEFLRVIRPGGVIALLAEPDYGSRIDYPQPFVEAGKLQRESLIRQGADPDIGRRVHEILDFAGCNRISSGILGSFNDAMTSNQLSLENSTLFSDFSKLPAPASISAISKLEESETNLHSRVQFVPTFFAWGFKPG